MDSPRGDAIEKAAKDVARQLREAGRGLDLLFIVHEPGRRDEALSLAEPGFLEHPAGGYLRPLLRTRRDSEDSAFYGLGVRTQKSFFGLMSRSSAIGLATINRGEFESDDAARSQMHHFVWHALDLMEARDRPGLKGKFDNGPMNPRRTQSGLARANLRADAFSAAMMAFEGAGDTAKVLAASRARQSLEARHGHDPSAFPYPLVAESAHLAIGELANSPPSRARRIDLARQIAEDVGASVDERLLRQWRSFCAPAQDMVWRGYDAARILGVAIHVSDDPYTRSAGYLVAEATGITPLSAVEVKRDYNAFADPEVNARAHREITEEVFSEAMAQGAFENSSSPFLAAANLQNRSLSEGRIFGWCAAALQAAARAFDLAIASDRPPAQAARERFAAARDETKWSALESLSEKVVEQKQSGYAVTLSGIVRLGAGTPELAQISNSVEMSLKDPEFVARLEAANALALGPQTPAPSGPSPSAPVPSYAPPAFAPPMPGLGGGAPVRAPQRSAHLSSRAQSGGEAQSGEDRASR